MSLRYYVYSSFKILHIWLLIILKGANSGIKSILNFYPDVGPLLGGFVVGFIAFVITYFVVANILKEKNRSELNSHERKSSILFVVSTVLIFIMTFPPVFEPIVDIFH